MSEPPVGTLLLSEPPRVFQVGLAELVGLEESIFLQQLHYRLVRTKHWIDGRPWVYNSYAEWEIEHPYWSHDQIQRIVTRLRKRGLVETRTLDRNPLQRRNWYTILYDNLAAQGGGRSREIASWSREIASPSRDSAESSTQICEVQDRKIAPSKQETSVHETSTETTPQEGVVGVEVPHPAPPMPPPPPPPGEAVTTPTPALPTLAVQRFRAMYPARGSPASDIRIRQDVIAAVGANISLTPVGLEHALVQAAGTDNPWPYALKVWLAKPDGPLQGAPHGHLAPSGPPVSGPARQPPDPAAQDRANAELLRALGGAVSDSLRPAG